MIIASNLRENNLGVKGLFSHNFKEILVQLWIIDVNFKFLCGNLPGDYIKSFAQHQCYLYQAMGFWETWKPNMNL